MHYVKSKFNCAECDYTAPKLSSVKLHMRVRREEKRYMCTECDYSAAQVIDLKTHLKVHYVKKQFNCAEFNYTVAKLISVKLHMRVHTMGKPYMCTESDCSISKSCSISNHKIMYIGDKPYQVYKIWLFFFTTKWSFNIFESALLKKTIIIVQNVVILLPKLKHIFKCIVEKSHINVQNVVILHLNHVILKDVWKCGDGGKIFRNVVEIASWPPYQISQEFCWFL